MRGDGYISRTAEALLRDRTLLDLSEAELIELLRSYNHVGATDAGAYVSELAVDRFPDNLELCRWRSSICVHTLALVDAKQEHLARAAKSGRHGSFWKIALADHLMCLAWDKDEEFLGGEPTHWELLDEAAALVADEATVNYYANHLVETGVWGGARSPMTFLEWFDGIFRFDKYEKPTGADSAD
jgi:hypothetical protein